MRALLKFSNRRTHGKFLTRICRGYGLSAYSAQPKIFLGAEPGVFHNAHGKAATDVTARMDRNGDGRVTFLVPQGKVTAGLAVFRGWRICRDGFGRDVRDPWTSIMFGCQRSSIIRASTICTM